MKINKININYRAIFIFLIILFLQIFFFSTGVIKAKAFEISNVEISKPFKMKFNKNKVIDDGFEKAFNELVNLIVNSLDQKKIQNIKLNEIKFMIDSFSIKEEKFIDEIYYLKLGVSFNKKKIFKFLESKNIFPSIPKRNKFLFIPIIIEQNENNLFIFTNNEIFKKWNEVNGNHDLIEYILPTEDIEDLELIKRKYDLIEQYDFKEIINKYYLRDSIISLIFKNDKKIRVLSRVSINNNTLLKNKSFSNLDFDKTEDINKIIKDLKIDYEDYWKIENQINTSIKLPLTVKANSSNENKIQRFEKILNEIDLIYNYSINKFDNNFIIYEIIFNGPPNVFLKSMSEKEFNFDIQNKEWQLK